ncbi:GNAT family N-acetyltransferase [Romboutsia sp.]|uniref:GNAT family N-acetyltransferase n=1 Tax=Romboutsia sp. TaxID=1965302 RepID=UPI003F37136A
MIVKVDSTYNNKIMEYLKREPDFNLFIIGDIEKYGYDNYFLTVWSNINKKGEVEGVLLKYFEFLIFYAHNKFDENEFANLINNTNYIELSGKTDVLKKLVPKLDLEKERVVNFCRLNNSQNLISTDSSIRVKKIRFGNINKVAKLYELIEEFDSTSVESIKSGLKSGRGYCIEMDKKVVAMVKSTCENNTHAMIVGVGTHPEYRNRGFATNCITKICKELINENKIPCLFYDNIEAGKIYRKLGFEDMGKWSIYSR